MRRWRARLEQDGYDGLRDRRRGKPSQKRVPLATCEQGLQLYQEKYFDFNVKHFQEKLKEVHGIKLSYTWVKQALQGAGLVARKRKRESKRRTALTVRWWRSHWRAPFFYRTCPVSNDHSRLDFAQVPSENWLCR
jgi:transposase